VQGQSWIPTAAVLGTTAGLMARDPSEAAYFRRTSSFRGFNNILTGNATVVGTIVAAASLYVIGLVRKDAKMQRTALLAGEAVADAEIVTTVLKDATRRVRPSRPKEVFMTPGLRAVAHFYAETEVSHPATP